MNTNYLSKGGDSKVGNWKPPANKTPIGSPTIPPATPQAPTLPPMPFNFNMKGAATGTGGTGAGTGTGTGGAGTGGPPTGGNLSEFRGSKSTELTDTFGKANELYANAPDMLERNLMKARDAATMAGREIRDMGFLAGGRTSPGKTTQLAGQLNRDLAGAAIDSATARHNMQLGALQPALGAGTNIAGDLRAQEGRGIEAYRASTDAWSAAQNAQLARERMALDSQLEGMRLASGMYNNMFNLYGNLLGGAFNAYGGYRF